jgi:hypothetical protein
MLAFLRLKMPGRIVQRMEISGYSGVKAIKGEISKSNTIGEIRKDQISNPGEEVGILKLFVGFLNCAGFCSAVRVLRWNFL